MPILRNINLGPKFRAYYISTLTFTALSSAAFIILAYFKINIFNILLLFIFTFHFLWFLALRKDQSILLFKPPQAYITIAAIFPIVCLIVLNVNPKIDGSISNFRDLIKIGVGSVGFICFSSTMIVISLLRIVRTRG